jgi:hypothetical protein
VNKSSSLKVREKRQGGELFLESLHSSSDFSSSQSSSFTRFHLLYRARSRNHFLVKPFDPFLKISILQLLVSIPSSIR